MDRSHSTFPPNVFFAQGTPFDFLRLLGQTMDFVKKMSMENATENILR